jgi:hypothetical protein
MTPPDTNFLLYGMHHREAAGKPLTAGPLTVTLQDGNLRTLRFMGHEVLRAVSFLVRDKDWGTCAADISDLAIEETGDDFSIRYHARYTAPSGAELDCNLAIAGSAEGHLSFAADCVSDADFETARAGFAVLHPVKGVAGEAVRVEHTDGAIEDAYWPDLIDPWQPFKDMRAITHKVALGISAETRFEGDIFEMEDQRNWTDGSYKTYVRPLALPWPYFIRKSEPLQQSVTVDIRQSRGAAAAPASTGPITLALSETDIPFPDIGIGLRPECLDRERSALAALKQTNARHLIAHFDPMAGHGLAAITGYAEIATASGLNVTLECAVPCIGNLDQELSDIAALVRQAGLPLDSLFVSPSVDRQSTPPGSQWPECPPLEDVYAAARKAFPGVRLGGGMMSYFTELNRKRVPGDLIDYVSHGTNPIVHAADDLSVMQAFEALAYVVKSVRAIYANKPYRIGPSTIAMRQNPYGRATKDNPQLERIPMANVDSRHNAQFGAAWTLAYAATVAPAGLEILTLSTLAGPFGLIAEADEAMPAGAARPLAHVLAALGALSGRRLVTVETSRPDAVLGLAARDEDGMTLLLANITPEPQTVLLPEGAGEVEALNITRGAGGFQPVDRQEAVTLGAYGCVRVVVQASI